ncbi:N-alpha-acetyltransferase 20-like isoform X1 [Drosophila teissieri]|uniref:N-alpha-acetyltransferase 20-like isoform X1 n=2 Tax=Drosophila teissieri TaxID=7243 RepID=UPI001CBA38E5|nr:N-alpha-acetyltransferase 20-like isoform X1 [Drosophila teissieri]
MTSFREMRFDDLFKINSLVFDALTEVYSLTFFVKHLSQFPGLSQVAEAPGPDARPLGYIFGQYQVKNPMEPYGHVAALTVSPEYRRLGLATALMDYFFMASDLKGASYVNLFMRTSNQAAYQLYTSMGYAHWQTFADYYPDDPMPENAYELRKYVRRPLEVQ